MQTSLCSIPLFLSHVQFKDKAKSTKSLFNKTRAKTNTATLKMCDQGYGVMKPTEGQIILKLLHVACLDISMQSKHISA
jgi:hypothetical protein